jgi:uncharacterized protein YcbK (DUF882 family)
VDVFMSNTSKHYNRRRVLAAGLSLPALTVAKLAFANTERRLCFHHTHTSEKLDLVYRDSTGYRADALVQVNHVLRDHRSGESVPMDPALLDLLGDLYEVHGSRGEFQVISGYRSPATNKMLSERSSGVAKKSLHMQGRAIDIRLTDVATSDLRDSALQLARGGVGYYSSSDFIHVDTGRVRRW